MWAKGGNLGCKDLVSKDVTVNVRLSLAEVVKVTIRNHMYVLKVGSALLMLETHLET